MLCDTMVVMRAFSHEIYEIEARLNANVIAQIEALGMIAQIEALGMQPSTTFLETLR